MPLFDPDDDGFIAPDDMPARIAAACRAAGQPAPDGKGEMVRSILTSLADPSWVQRTPPPVTEGAGADPEPARVVMPTRTVVLRRGVMGAV